MSTAEDIKTIKLDESEEEEFFDKEEEVETEQEEEDDDKESIASGGSSASSLDTIKLLSNDPLFLVLSKTFVNKNGHNIVDVLEKINLNLEKLLASNSSTSS